jgi:nicotinate-nucleotide adenylyltransferase
MNKIIIFGGTFNPIHNGHLRIARYLELKFRPDRILFIPCHTPYHKNYQGLADPIHRLEMARLAIADIPGWAVSDMDIKRGGRTFSVDTIKALRMKSRAGTEFYFIIGVDSLADLPGWYKIEELSRLCKFITVARPGYRFSRMVRQLPDYLARDIKQLYQADLRLDISSTRVRRNIKTGKPIKSLVPVTVENYIKQTGLYE